MTRSRTGTAVATGAATGGRWRPPLAGAGHEVRFVGSVHDAAAGLDHEGHCGWEIDDIAGEVVGWLRAATPTAVLLHLGTNDLYREVDIPNAPARLGPTNGTSEDRDGTQPQSTRQPHRQLERDDSS